MIPGAGSPADPPTEPAGSSPRVLSEATTVARAQDGDVAAFTVLVRSYEAELFRLVYRMLNDRGDAQDVLQDAFVLVWRRLPSLTEPQAFRAWIYHLTTRQCLNVLRARNRRPAAPTSDDELEAGASSLRPAADDGPAAAAVASAGRAALDEVLATIPAEQRACWVLREIHQLSYPEIAYAIGIPVSTVRGRLVRARQQLAKGMTAWR